MIPSEIAALADAIAHAAGRERTDVDIEVAFAMATHLQQNNYQLTVID